MGTGVGRRRHSAVGNGTREYTDTLLKSMPGAQLTHSRGANSEVVVPIAESNVSIAGDDKAGPMTADRDRQAVEWAQRVLERTLALQGGPETVLAALGAVAGLQFTPRQRRGVPARLTTGDWSFVAAEPPGQQMQVRHTVRGVTLSTAVLGPAEAARRLVPAVLNASAQQGQEAADQAVAVIAGLGDLLGG